MKPRALFARALEPLLVLASGLLLWALLVILDRVAAGAAQALLPGLVRAGLAASVLVEEGVKALLILGYALGEGPREALRRRLGGELDEGEEGAPRWPGLALAAIVVFAAAENLAYLLAFPGPGVFARLLWALPVHLGAALAFIVALQRGRAVGIALALLLALGWHLSANLLASSGPSAGLLALGAALSLLGLLGLSRLWLHTVIVEGSIHGTTRQH